MRRIDVNPGDKHGLLTVVGLEPSKNGQRMIRCRCECGTEGSFMLHNVRRGNTTSCGCHRLRRQVESNLRHGQAGAPIYKCWVGMKMRSDPGYTEYGYGGVGRCSEWETFEGFLNNQPPGRAYEPGLVLARFGDTGDYSPENTRWATKSENSSEMHAARRASA